MRYVLSTMNLFDERSEPDVDVLYIEDDGSLLNLDTSITRYFRLIREYRESEAYAFRRILRFAGLEFQRSGAFVYFHQRETNLLTDFTLCKRQVPIPRWWSDRLWALDGLIVGQVSFVSY